MTTINLPPVPLGLCEMLKDYPEYVLRIQQTLNDYVSKPFALIPFDGAIWALEGMFDELMPEARKELRAVENTKDLIAIERRQKPKDESMR
jgi:hypothetical protein